VHRAALHADVARLHRHRVAVVEFEVAFALEADRVVESLGAVPVRDRATVIPENARFSNIQDVPKPDLYAAGELRTLPAIRLRRRDQQGSTHILSGRSASSIDAFPRKVDGFLTRFAILCSRKASSESPLWLHLKSRQ
jgi:hypothetical protein